MPIRWEPSVIAAVEGPPALRPKSHPDFRHILNPPSPAAG